jgi:hypothetical protein
VTRDQETAGARLALMMRRRGWSAPRLAELTGGVSASSIRAYLADRTVPRPSQALAVANGLGPVDGKTLLEAWGFTDLAEGFHAKWREGVLADDDGSARRSDLLYRFNHIEYPGETLSDAGQELARAVVAWVQHLERSTANSAQAPKRQGPAHPRASEPD